MTVDAPPFKDKWTARMTMPFPDKMYIDGALVDGAATLDIMNPANGEKVVTVAAAGCADADHALMSARAAAPMWGATPIAERQGWMHKLRDAVIANEDHLRSCVHYEMGKSWADTKEDFDLLERALSYYAEEIARVHDTGLADRAGTHAHRLIHEPAGVVLAFLSWNFPLLNLAYKLAPAMAAGCPIILRASEKTPVSAYAVGALCHQIGLPAGVVQILTTESYAVADHLTASPVPAMVTLIGSTATGRHIMQTGATTIKRYSMELGGNAPVLIFPDADLDKAADVVCGIKFSNAGQICVAPNRVFVHHSVLADFTSKVVDRAKSVKVGWDKDGPIGMGPVIDRRAWTRLKCMIDEAALEGATVLAGGTRPKGLTKGHFLAPTVLGDVTEDMAVYREETFGLPSFGNDMKNIDIKPHTPQRGIPKKLRYSPVLNSGTTENRIRHDLRAKPVALHGRFAHRADPIALPPRPGLHIKPGRDFIAHHEIA